ncbi:tetratricopeptide repeat-containing sensor histidine kinase [Olleya sp. HaHaR_3_96]|uniref:tetratricopeptide repeat-containing sensor histidine kinase n=1 Tax=Olleya sp. HaHaR_3_96 TaxID=2745560 RepID=UPI001C4F9240|nr:tetratricopeptide repeat-containing sensor histidine kinase [Olleya sp. HaHaR_3_96]QXP60051.1 tetratricopeptide repeat-containing sensor histidine kinase [Olleya sp. HaHaR_3_96]
MKRLIVLFCLLNFAFSFSQDEELERLTIQLAYQDPGTSKIKTSVSIIKLLFESKKYSKALKFVHQSEKLAKDLGYKKGLAEILYFKAKINNKEGYPTKAVLDFKAAKRIFQLINDTIAVAKTNSNIGVLEIKNGNYQTGMTYALSAIPELEKRDLYSQLSLNYESLAHAYETSGDLEKAITFNLKKLEVDNKDNNIEGLINTNKSLGTLYTKKEDHKQAISYFESALGYANSNDEQLRAQILPHLGHAYLKDKDYSTCTRYLAESINLNRRFDNKPEILMALNSLGEVNLIQNRLNTAEAQLLEAVNLSRIIKNDEQLLRNYKLMKILDSTNGKFDTAFVWQSKYYSLKEKIEAKNKPVQIETTIDTTSNTDALLFPIKTNDSVISKKKYDKFKLIFYALLAAFAVVLTFFVLFYLKRNNSAKYTKALEEKNKKIELQNEAILEQSKHLESINRVKDKLFSIVSHDLKDSLTSTKGFIDLLKEGQLTQDEFHSLLPELSESANNASLLLFNLLNWSKSQMQSLDPKPTLFNIQAVFADKVKLIDQKLDSKGVSLIDNTSRDFVYADQSMIEIVIQNLLANAVKFCNRGDSITMSNQISNGNVLLSVSDTGVGIDKANQAKLFGNNTFTTRGTNKEKGTGLGLTICRELVTLNKGTIWVESELNIGSTFYVALPRNKI